MKRSAGILMPMSALPSPYGIGTLGSEARKFIDFLVDAGQTYWQILPLGPTGFGNSPYQPLSSYAGSPYLIDLDLLIEQGLLTKKEVSDVVWHKTAEKTDYGILYNERFKVLRKAADRLPLVAGEDYFTFLKNEEWWLRDYAVFMAIKEDRQGKPWSDWPEALRHHDSPAVREEAERLAEKVIFHERLQYLFACQYEALRAYAKAKDIRIIGDLPFYVAADAADVWENPELFTVDQAGRVTLTGGMPDGQKWGSPLFNWERMKEDDYHWWMERAAYHLKRCDVLRIDHFQGYESYYAIPYGAKGPDAGVWCKGVGLAPFAALEEKYGPQEMILEDIGVLTETFKALIISSGKPGMRVIQYGFEREDPASWYMPFQYIRNTVVYPSTHDTNTLQGWIEDKKEKPRWSRCMEYFNVKDKKDLRQTVIKAVYASVGDLAIVPIQDILGLDGKARFNNPSGSDNWTWRMKKGALTPSLARQLKSLMDLYCRGR